MKKMKPLLAALLALVMVLTMAGCGEKDPMLGKYMLTEGVNSFGEPLEIDGEYMTLEKDGEGKMFSYGLASPIEWSCSGKDFTMNELGFEAKGIAEDGYIVLDYDGKLCIFAKEGVTTPAVEDYFSEFEYFKDFAAGDGDEAPQTPSDGQETQQTSEPQGFWEGDWYGWYMIDSGSGEYEILEGYAFDCCAAIVRNSDDTGYIDIWDDEFSRSDPMISVDVTFGDGTTEDGAMMSESGYFLDCEIGHADWIVDAGVVYPETSVSDKPIWINGTYTESDNEDNSFQYSIYLRPWGADWDELIAEDPEFWIPIHYEDWYLPLIASGKSMPDTLVFDGSAAPADSQPSAAGTSAVGTAVDGVITVSSADLAIVINGTTVPRPFRYADLVAAGVPADETAASNEISANGTYGVNLYLDENDDYWVSPNYCNYSTSPITVADADADSISLCSYPDTPVDQGVSIWGVKLGMTKDEISAMFGAPSEEEGGDYRWEISVSDTGGTGSFMVWFTDDGLVSHIFLNIY